MDTRWLDHEGEREIRDIAQRAVLIASKSREEVAAVFGVESRNRFDPDLQDAAVPYARDARERFVASRLAEARTADVPHLAAELVRGVRGEDFGYELDIARGHMRDVGVPARLHSPTPMVVHAAYSRLEERSDERLPDASAWSVTELARGFDLARGTMGVQPYERGDHGPRGKVAVLMHVQLPTLLELAGAKPETEHERVRAEMDIMRYAVVRTGGAPGLAPNVTAARELGTWIKPHLALGGGDYLGLGGYAGGGLEHEGRGMIEATIAIGIQAAGAQRVRDRAQVMQAGVETPQRAAGAIAAAAAMAR